jgi:hypothetical protein
VYERGFLDELYEREHREAVARLQSRYGELTRLEGEAAIGLLRVGKIHFSRVSNWDPCG